MKFTSDEKIDGDKKFLIVATDSAYAMLYSFLKFDEENSKKFQALETAGDQLQFLQDNPDHVQHVKGIVGDLSKCGKKQGQSWYQNGKEFFYDGTEINKTKVAIGAAVGTAALFAGGAVANEVMGDNRTFTQKHGGKIAAGVIGTAAAAGVTYCAYKNGMLPIKPDDHETTSGESTLDTSSGKRTGSSSKRSSGSSGSGDAPKKSNKGLLIGVVVIVLGVIAFFVLSGGDEEESEAPMGDDLV